MVNETRKILEDDSIGITATTVRVPVFYSHSESVNIETNQPISAAEVRTLLEKEPGVMVVDDLEKNFYPLAIDAAGRDEIFVGRIREDESVPNGINNNGNGGYNNGNGDGTQSPNQGSSPRQYGPTSRTTRSSPSARPSRSTT